MVNFQSQSWVRILVEPGEVHNMVGLTITPQTRLINCNEHSYIFYVKINDRRL